MYPPFHSHILYIPFRYTAVVSRVTLYIEFYIVGASYVCIEQDLTAMTQPPLLSDKKVGFTRSPAMTNGVSTLQDLCFRKIIHYTFQT